MAAVTSFVVDEADVEPVREEGDTASTRLTFEAEHLEQRVIRFAPGRSRERTADGRHDLDELLAVLVSATADLDVDEARRHVTIRFDDQQEHTASVERRFRYLVNEDAGCLDVTQFIGLVEPSKAPFHSHPYEELGYIVEGEGVAHVGGRSVPLRPGSCFHLPPEKVHCIENVGPGQMRILGVFHPSDSPANRVYQDNK